MDKTCWWAVRDNGGGMWQFISNQHVGTCVGIEVVFDK